MFPVHDFKNSTTAAMRASLDFAVTDSGAERNRGVVFCRHLSSLEDEMSKSMGSIIKWGDEPQGTNTDRLAPLI